MLKQDWMEFDYIFLDEVSMISCNDNYKNQLQLAKALNEFDLPYGELYDILRGLLLNYHLCLDFLFTVVTGGPTADVTYDCPRSRSCYWKGTLASNDHSCDTEKE